MTARRPSRWLVACALGLAALAGCGGPQTAVSEDEAPELIGVWYTVESGDSVSRIAERNGVPVEDIVELNGLVDPDRLEVGQPLFLYGIDELLARRAVASAPAANGGGSKPASRPKASPAPRRPDSKKPAPPKPATGGKSPYIWPIDGGTLTSGFGPRGRRVHKGIDIAADIGTPIKAVADGKVIYSDNKQRGYGNLVILQHGNDAVTVYAHNRRNLVDEGDTVRQGAVIAELGNTGRSTGPHLHFELRLESKAVDPLVHLPAR